MFDQYNGEDSVILRAVQLQAVTSLRINEMTIIIVILDFYKE